MDLKKELSDIKEVLRLNPRGMTVTEIAKAIKMNRHSTAKYLDMLEIAGHVDLRSFGASKVYYPSRRLPMSAILNFSSDFILVLDHDLNVVNVNDRFLDFEGVKKQDIIARSIVNATFPMAFTPSIIPQVKKAIAGDESVVEATLEKGGTAYYYNVKFIPTVFDDSTTGVTIIFEDITARKEADVALKDSEERFRAIFENAAVGIAYLSNEARFVRQNRRFTDILGYTQGDLMKLSYLDITHPEDRKASLDNVGLLYAGKIDYFSMEKRYITGDGHTVWGHVTCSPIRGSDGAVKYTIAVLEDITARKAAEAAVRHAHEDLEARVFEQTKALVKANESLMAEAAHSKRMEMEARRAMGMMREVLEKAPFGVYIMNEQGTVDYVNPAMLKITGVNERAFRQLNLLELPTYVAIGVDKLLREALRGKNFFLGPVMYTSHLGNKASVRIFTGIPMDEGGSNKVMVFVEDFSKYKLLEEALMNKH